MPHRLEALACALPMITLLAGCSTSIGALSSRTVSDQRAGHAGLGTLGMVELPVFDTKANLALGLSSVVLQRYSPRGSAWGDWRLGTLVGLTQMPRPNEFRLGYEGFFTAGLARYQSASGARVGSALGLMAGAPLRLGRQLPTWRADELVAFNFYLVPSLGITRLGFDQTEVTFGLAFRGNLWSSAIA